MQIRYFEKSFNLYTKYKESNEKSNPEGFDLGLTVSGIEILLQLDFLINEIIKLNNIAINRNNKLTLQANNWKNKSKLEGLNYRDFLIKYNLSLTKVTEDLPDINDVLFKTKLFSETFYYKAFRLRNIIRYSYGLGKIFECEGIRNVRNILIEHPEKQKQEFVNSFAMGKKEVGPVLQAIHRNNEIRFKDLGLFKNSQEFDNNLQNVLIKYFETH